MFEVVGEEDLIVNNEKSVGQRNVVMYKKYDVNIIVSNYNKIVCVCVCVCVCAYIIGERTDMEEELDTMEKLLEEEVCITPSSASVYCFSFYFSHQQPH